jgi:hypothetical protein
MQTISKLVISIYLHLVLDRQLWPATRRRPRTISADADVQTEIFMGRLNQLSYLHRQWPAGKVTDYQNLVTTHMHVTFFLKTKLNLHGSDTHMI